MGGAEIAGLGLRAREVVARKERTAVASDAEDEDILRLESPPGLAGESQCSTSTTLAIRSQEQPGNDLLYEGAWLPILLSSDSSLQSSRCHQDSPRRPLAQSGRDNILRST